MTLYATHWERRRQQANDSVSLTTYVKTGLSVARARSVGGLDGRRQAHREVFTASSRTSSNSPGPISRYPNALPIRFKALTKLSMLVAKDIRIQPSAPKAEPGTMATPASLRKYSAS